MYVAGRLVHSWSKDQSKIARSSREAELYGANLRGTKGLGMKSLMRELGWPCNLRIEVDTYAAIGILRKRGFGKQRHIEVEELWMQQELKRGKLTIRKVKGTENTADVGTKAVTKDALEYYLWKMGVESIEEAGDACQNYKYNGVHPGEHGDGRRQISSKSKSASVDNWTAQFGCKMERRGEQKTDENMDWEIYMLQEAIKLIKNIEKEGDA